MVVVVVTVVVAIVVVAIVVAFEDDSDDYADDEDSDNDDNDDDDDDDDDDVGPRGLCTSGPSAYEQPASLPLPNTIKRLTHQPAHDDDDHGDHEHDDDHEHDHTDDKDSLFWRLPCLSTSELLRHGLTTLYLTTLYLVWSVNCSALTLHSSTEVHQHTQNVCTVCSLH